MTPEQILALAKECGATTYTNRHMPEATALAFGPLAWETFCAQMAQAAQPAEAQPVAHIRTWHKNGDQHAELLDWEAALFKLPDGEHKLYTAPPARQPLIARQIGEWHEDDGPVTWWAWNGREWAGEPGWIGQPTDSDWPGYHTHWTPHPDIPAKNGITAKGDQHE